MTTVWIAIAAVAVANAAFKAAGPVAVGRRALPPPVTAVIALLAPALLAALVVSDTLTHGQGLAVDAKVVGVAVAAIALALRAPMLLVVTVAAVATAVARALS
jgi:branched-subunit amino acid transport protein